MSKFEPFRGLILCSAIVALAAPLLAATEARSRLDEVLDAVVANEVELAETLRDYRPLVETYVQTVADDAALGAVPLKDDYFIGRLDLAAGGSKRSRKKKAVRVLNDFHSEYYNPENFARMLTLDLATFDREHYDFDFVRAEFLGEVRTLVFDVTPRVGKVSRMSSGRFTGRIWVEDDDFHIVRYNGIHTSALSVSFHFDSWRLDMPSEGWMPAYVYTEESERIDKQQTVTHKGQTRIWGYRIHRPDVEDEFTKILVDAKRADDPSDRPGQISPLASVRAWASEAEDNLLQRLERAGLLAPASDVDQVLSTVVANLEITNALEIDPPVRCRVLLTTPLESFTVGHTIVLSRGLIDVLPDEASLATVLAHELGHVLSGHEVDTKFAFSNQMLVGDKTAMKRLAFERSIEDEHVADARAMELLENSPYKAELANAGLFLQMLADSTESLSSLMTPHFGHRIDHETPMRASRILEPAPELDRASASQIPALPLGSRVNLDPWSARIELMKNNIPALQSARDKMPLLVTPLMPYLARSETRAAGRKQGRAVASSNPGSKEN